MEKVEKNKKDWEGSAERTVEQRIGEFKERLLNTEYPYKS